MSQGYSRETTRRTKRSKTACTQCRRRRVKCDEARPTCGQCMRAERDCDVASASFRPYSLSSETAGDFGQPLALHLHSDTIPGDDSRQEPADYSFNAATNEGAVGALTGAILTAQPSLQPSEYSFQSPSGARRTGTGPRAPAVPEKLEEDFFLRYFSERLAPWLDVVNFQRYFGHECIILTREHPLLRYSACALAGKQLGQSAVSKSRLFESATQRESARQLLATGNDFTWYGVKYYDKAIKTLSRSIRPPESHQTSVRSPETSSPAMSLPQSDIMTRAEGEDPIARLLATCLLVEYEHLSGNKKGWTGHLNGFSKLLTLLDDGSLFYHNPLSHQLFDAKSQRALRAAFWWWVVNDVEESFVFRRRARVDPGNISLWQHMGLHMHEDGSIVDLDVSATPEAPPHLQGDLQSFALIRLAITLVNAISLPQEQEMPSPMASEHASVQRLESLQTLQQEFEIWHSKSTAAFRPDSITASRTSDDISVDIFGSATWYSHEFRAVTMLYYHMCRLLLTIHLPPNLVEGGAQRSFDLLLALRTVEKRLKDHSRQIIAIANGMNEYGSVRARTLQPLYVSGRTITSTTDRRQLVTMIRSLQDDLGMACEYRVKHLLEEWAVSLDMLGLEDRESHLSDSS